MLFISIRKKSITITKYVYQQEAANAHLVMQALCVRDDHGHDDDHDRGGHDRGDHVRDDHDRDGHDRGGDVRVLPAVPFWHQNFHLLRASI